MKVDDPIVSKVEAAPKFVIIERFVFFCPGRVFLTVFYNFFIIFFIHLIFCGLFFLFLFFCLFLFVFFLFLFLFFAGE